MNQKWHYRLVVFFLLLNATLSAQGLKYIGVVADQKSKEPLAFVNIISSNGIFGTTSDIDGKFSIVLPEIIDSIRFSYLGYETIFVSTRDLKGPKTVFLKARQFDLAEFIVVPGVNPAHRIVLNAVNNRMYNDPKKLNSYAYTTYDKMIITIDTSSLKQDSIQIENDTIGRLLSFFKNKDLFLMETAVEKKFMAPDKSNEKVIATKVSGLKDPMIAYLVSQIQSTSFYDDIIHIANRNYINPISKGSLSKYYFQMEDTLFSGKRDTIFTISFQPMLNTNFDGMKGILHISTNKWAIVNVKAQPAKEDQGIAVQIQQKYELVDGEHWFPVQLNTNITFDALQVSSGGQNSRLLGIGKTYIKDIELNPELVKKAFSHIEIELDPNAAYRKEEQWKAIRIDSLSIRDAKTYQFMDSVGREAKFDQKLKSIETLLSGKIGWGCVDLLLDRFVGYNSYEGFWLGAGFQTNKRFSENINFGGYLAYSFKDKQLKTAVDAGILLYKPKEIKAHFAYSADNIENGSVRFLYDESALFDPHAFRNYFVNSMNFTTQKEVGLSGRMFKYVQVFASAKMENTEVEQNYQFLKPTIIEPITDFKTSEIQLKIRFAYKEKYFDNGRMLLSMGTNYPLLWFNYTQGFTSFFDGDFAFKKFDLQIRESFYTKYLGESTIDFRSGVVLGDISAAKLYSGSGTYELITIWAPASFGAMRPSEFLSDRYVSLFFSHNFGSLLFKGKKFKPEFELITNIGFGWLEHPEYHQNIDFKTMEKGYYESGLMINNLVRLYLFDLGIGGVYRYGSYSYAYFKDNISFKITLTMPLKAEFRDATK